MTKIAKRVCTILNFRQNKKRTQAIRNIIVTNPTENKKAKVSLGFGKLLTFIFVCLRQIRNAESKVITIEEKMRDN